MNRVVLALAVGLVGVGLMGCAAGVDDPVLPQPAPEPQRDPIQKSLSGELNEPRIQEIATIDNRSVNAPQAHQRPPTPQPEPMDETR